MEKEDNHRIQVIQETIEAIKNEDVPKLKDLSNQTIHSASGIQDSGSLTLVVLIYSLGKLIERKESMKIPKWNEFVKKIISYLNLAIKALEQDRTDKYEDYLLAARKSFTSISLNLKPYIQDIIRKASINKASKIYEHGISLGRTAELLGITEWELAEYTGQTEIPDAEHNLTLSIKQRASMALEFFK